MFSRSNSFVSRKRLIFAIALFALPAIAIAQTATVQGRITDQSGAVVPGAHVSAKKT